MTSTMMMERAVNGAQGVTGVTSGPGVMSPTGSNWLAVPRCTFKFEKCTNGLKVTCSSDDPVARSMMQQLCSSLTGGLCSCFCTLNGSTVCHYNFTVGMCKCEMTETGFCVTCTSGDSTCCAMLQSCCDCLSCLCTSGCTCCFLMNNMPVCCGSAETSVKAPKR